MMRYVIMMNNLLNFLKYYVISMRLHFGFITGVAGWIGISYYEYIYGPVSVGLKVFFLVALFLSYGVNQVINDYFGLSEDKINAPNRPMVSGKLNPFWALLVSVFMMMALGVISYFVSPISVLPLVAGVVLNIIYEYAKSISLLGNIIFGLSISTCPIYGFLLLGPKSSEIGSLNQVWVLLILTVANGLMTYFTYFKDYEGDLKTGKRTFIVKHGPEFSAKAGIAFSLIPGAIFLLGFSFGAYSLETFGHLALFWPCLAVTFFLQIWTAVSYYRFPTGDSTYYNLCRNIQACVALQATVIAGFNGKLGLILLLLTYFLIKLIFNFHRDAKA